jgi:hypothetical protein
MLTVLELPLTSSIKATGLRYLSGGSVKKLVVNVYRKMTTV